MIKFLRIISFIILIYFGLVLYRDLYIYPQLILKCKKRQEKLKNILPDVIKKLDEYNITYFIFGGTLLGYKRHDKKFIPWDDDIDIIILNTEDLDIKIKKIKEDFKNKYDVKDVCFGYKILFEDIFIDLFIYDKVEKNKYIPTSIFARVSWPNDYFYEDEIYPIQKDFFENIELNIPFNSENYLRRQYGNYEKINLSHTHTNIFHNIIIFITNNTHQLF